MKLQCLCNVGIILSRIVPSLLWEVVILVCVVIDCSKNVRSGCELTLDIACFCFSVSMAALDSDAKFVTVSVAKLIQDQ